ncbi:FAD-binding domain-containing protein [Cubamyces lactineus]|nr:FAD-binding domain-containing protein [Cubamyces lactineus]
MSDFQALRSTFKGDLVQPGDPGYGQAIARWAKNAARKAAVVAFVKDEADVASAIAYARKAGLPIAIKGGGHNPSAASSSEGGLVIDLSRYLAGVRVDADKKLAYVGGGAIWETVDKAAIEYGLATVGGTVNHCMKRVICVTSDIPYRLTLGGGYGWLSGAHGLAVDNVVQATVVTADGRALTANETENPDLFWGIRGGGSNFGVVTEFVLKLHPQRRTVFAGPIVFSPDKLEQLLDVVQEWWTKGPSEKEGMLQVFTRGPDGKPCIVCFVFYNGSEEEGLQAYKHLLDLGPVAVMAKEMPYEELNALQNPIARPGQNAYMKGAFVPPTLTRAELTRVFARATALSVPGSFAVNLLLEYFPLRAANAVRDDATPYVRGLTANALCLVIAADDAEGAEAQRYMQDAARELIGMFAESPEANMGYGNYSPDSDALVNQGSVPVDKAKLIFRTNYPRLQQIKKKYDPDMVFNKWFVITPAA